MAQTYTSKSNYLRRYIELMYVIGVKHLTPQTCFLLHLKQIHRYFKLHIDDMKILRN